MTTPVKESGVSMLDMNTVLPVSMKEQVVLTPYTKSPLINMVTVHTDDVVSPVASYEIGKFTSDSEMALIILAGI